MFCAHILNFNTYMLKPVHGSNMPLLLRQPDPEKQKAEKLSLVYFRAH